MKVKLVLLIILFTSALNSQQLFYNLGDLKLKSGNTLTETKIGYRTFGKMNEEKSNVVAFLSWYAGSSEDMIASLGKGKLIDTTLYFTILVDALGNGISTSPTNFTGTVPFPEITISDMIESQYLLFTKHLGLTSIHAIIGGSMGGMQVYQWMVSYPKFARKFIPYVGTPIQSSVNQLNFEVSLQILQTIEKYGVPDSVANRIFDLNFYLLARTSSQVDTLYDPGEYGNLLKKFKGVTAERFPASNRIAQMKAMINHDITKDFGGSLEEAAKRVSGEVFIIVSATDQLILPNQSIKFAKIIKTDLMEIKND
jgi:homoserine O-acetyltransferase